MVCKHCKEILDERFKINYKDIKLPEAKSLPCIEESEMEGKYILERILKRYRSAWKKLVEYDSGT